jgi:hypothetical protein
MFYRMNVISKNKKQTKNKTNKHFKTFG